MVFEVDAAVGARIVTFSLGGTNLLTGPSVNPDNYGATFWPSPQSTTWNWPPIVEIDSAAYTPSVQGTTLTLVGPTNSRWGLSLTKKFTANSADTSVTVEYVLTNHAGSAASWAPWEITRVAGGGLTFWTSNPTNEGSGQFAALTTTEASGVTWFPYGTISADSKRFDDATEGWIAHAASNLLLVKAFPNITQAQEAPGEAEIEIFATPSANPASRYVEVEQQGAYQSIPAGGSLSWTVRWVVRQIPSSVSVAVGSAELVNLARSAAASP